jgi:excisionase family DNA binding protein
MQNLHNGHMGHLTPLEAADVLGTSPATIYRHTTRLGGVKVFGRWRLRADAVHAVLAGGAR